MTRRASRLARLTAAAVIGLGATLPNLAHAFGLIRDAEIERTLADMSAPVFSAAGLSPATIDIYIINDPSLNAFVAGGRNVFLHTGLLVQLGTPEELIGVIAHETGHIAGGHLTRRMINLRNAQGPALIGLLLGIAAAAAAGSGDAGAAIAAGSQSLITRNLLRFNRGEEAAADQAALDYMARARVNPEGMLKVLERFRGQEVLSVGNLDPYTLTHPLSTQRMQLIEREVAESKGRSYPSDPERDYWHGRMRAKLEGFLSNPQRVLDKYENAEETEQVLYAKAVAYHRLPDQAKALAAMDRLLALRPNDPFYLELKGQLLFEQAHPEEAVSYYRKAVAAAPDEPLLKAGLGRVLIALNTKATDAEALKVLESARRDDPGDPSMLRDLAIAYSRAGNDGMAALVTAERFALNGDRKDAALHARRASTILPQGSPGWLRAQDIVALADEKD
ncbi:M48 family metalloprotease [Limibaculum sp. M0105]|uniref:M48 family metalloprotease n=1 Tax=Thermohalobaculum xanthum TaxID=2753746 RepID=A0A8J7SC25_9RHOB|nr:M48 family metalloprotease [Thermohalobaculum xanthum]MBK0397981.1 M48 family metalloprotease [Thermohalobaculum xanthum]